MSDDDDDWMYIIGGFFLLFFMGFLVEEDGEMLHSLWLGGLISGLAEAWRSAWWVCTCMITIIGFFSFFWWLDGSSSPSPRYNYSGSIQSNADKNEYNRRRCRKCNVMIDSNGSVLKAAKAVTYTPVGAWVGATIGMAFGGFPGLALGAFFGGSGGLGSALYSGREYCKDCSRQLD